ncbi:hypothetical protein BBO99_00003825 [Phytophthora kernoviae]|uniref:Protein kinase domain-containing protein n=1 Tax=Phytophthora kernoviae TaxID=325452 RepID=A0A421GSU9_9STRA|nr:hypothetical protein BBO99_00003825 [Phytophthora kernoviae]
MHPQIKTQSRRQRLRLRLGSWLAIASFFWVATSSPAVLALVQQTQVIARCLKWVDDTCVFAPLDPIHFAGLKLSEQTVCKADLSVSVKQIDWESPAGGRGSVDSFMVNGVEMLSAPVHPSKSYLMANYPHCNDMFNIFPPWGNGVIGPDGHKSIIPQVTSEDLPVSIHFNWEGPHEVFPVCSMVGVSISGYAEINIYLEAQDNSATDMLGPTVKIVQAVFLAQSAIWSVNRVLMMVVATQRCPDCNFPHGNCDDGLMGSGRLATSVRPAWRAANVAKGDVMMAFVVQAIAIATAGPSFLNRGNSFSQSEYVEISDMSDLEYFVSNDTRDWLIPFDSLSLQCEVGNGTSGQVFRSLLHSGGGSSVVAVKRLYSPVTGQEYFQSFFRREVSILSRLHHPNVVRFYGVSYYNRVLYIVTDFCPKSLSGLIENPAAKGPLEESVFMKVISQIVSGMGFLHSRNVVHRDLKPANVLISETDDVNICDFGLSRLIEPDATTMTAEVGTPSYMAPEMATMGGIQCSTKGDVYSFGILLYSTWSRSKPYGDQGMNPFQLMTAVVNGLRPVIPISCPPALARLMRACWHQDSDVRPSFPEISQILKDQWLLSMFAEEEEDYYPDSLAHSASAQLMSASSSMSTIPAAAADYHRGSKDSINAMSPFASPRHGGGDGYGTYKEGEASPREDDRLLNEQKRPA